MDSYIELNIVCSETLKEILIAELSCIHFDAFQEIPSGLNAYCEASRWEERKAKEILSQYDIKTFSTQEIKAKNWNEYWEQNFTPVYFGNILTIRAPFHTPTPSQYDIVISPKMSFGTGHHATTHLMVEYLLTHNIEKKYVVDFGCGTGILSILAAKRGASCIWAFDHDEGCVVNTQDNIERNHVADAIRVQKGSISDLKQQKVDIILANINRKTHITMMKYYRNCLADEGKLVLSGFYKEDLEWMNTSLSNHQFSCEELKERDKWILMECCK